MSKDIGIVKNLFGKQWLWDQYLLNIYLGHMNATKKTNNIIKIMKIIEGSEEALSLNKLYSYYQCVLTKNTLWYQKKS